MAYDRFFLTVRDQQGNAVNGASCTVFNGGLGSTAVIYDPNSNDASPSPMANPFVTTANGRFGFMADDGLYDVKVEGGGIAQQNYRVQMFSSSSVAGASNGTTTFDPGGDIVFTGINGQVITTTFVGNTIVETYGPPASLVVTTTFNSDGSIMRVSMVTISVDPQAHGFRDDGTESGLIRSEPNSGRWYLMSWRRGGYTSAAGGTATVGAPGSLSGSALWTGTSLQMTVPANAALGNGTTMGFWIHSKKFALRYVTASGVPPGCTIDGVTYDVPLSEATAVNPITLSGIGYDESPLVHVADDLGEGFHFVELSFPCAATGSTRSWVLHGYAVDSIDGYEPRAPEGRVGSTQITLTGSYQAMLGTASSTNVRTVRKLFFYNSTAGAITATLKHSVYGVFWTKAVPAGETAEWDPGIAMADGVELQAIGNGLTCTIVGGL